MNIFNLKKITFVFLCILGLNSFLNAQLKTLSNGKQIDEKLVGVWVGSENDKQIDGVSKEWEMTRNEDGTFILDFTFTQNGKSQNTQETGDWWIENGKFHEYHAGSDLTDTYEYKPMGTTRVKFKSINMSMEMNTDSYEFIDTRKITPTRKKDGLSFKNAIKVKSVSEEYKLLKEMCSDCKNGGQALTESDGKYYDVFTVEKPDGTMIRYHFDINSFYGKW